MNPASIFTVGRLPTIGAGVLSVLALGAPSPVFARTLQEVAPIVAIVDKGDVAWMLTSTLLVLLMTMPGLALFYGGMVRSKNVLSVLIQIMVIFSLLILLWAVYGYSLAFVGGNAVIGSFDKLFLAGVSVRTYSDTFTANVKLPEYAFIAFQATFAGITGALIIGAFAERLRFAALILFSVLWFSFGYLPIAHMVWGSSGYLSRMGALDFAGGTVVHINAGVAGLVGAWFVGKRLGFGREAIKPHNVTMTFVGAAMLWVGWFGFNAGSALESNAAAALAFINTLLATAAAIVAWAIVEAFAKGKPSALGVASGAVSGLVGVTPAAGLVGPFGAVAIGAVVGVVCVWAVTRLKKILRVDDSLDVFGVHGIGGIVGALLTGIFHAHALGGNAGENYSILGQLGIQALAVLITIGWIGIVSVISFLIAKAVFGLRVTEEEEREGLDITYHGESAYEN